MEPGAQAAYEKLYDLFMAISDDDLSHSNMPLEIETAEATQLAIVAVEDRKQLMEAGIDPAYVDTLMERADALAYAAATFQLVVDTDPEASKMWKDLSPAGHAVQKYMLKFLAFAYRKDENLTMSVNKIKEGRGNKDMILDLLTVHILATENMGPLDKMAMFDKSKINEAKQLHDQLSEIYARATIDPKKVDEAKIALNHAYTYYKQAADEVKAHGVFLFEGTDRYQSYISDFRSEIGKKKTKDKPAATPRR